jgi:hypothetical protein
LAAHPPGSSTSDILALSGWDFGLLSSSAVDDRVNHYYFTVTNGPGDARCAVTATLVWNRQQGQAAVNDLDLFLYDCATSNLIAQSISGPDNCEVIYTNVPPGRYDLQVLKYGGLPVNGNVTSNESYALAWEFFATPLALSATTTNVSLHWPVYPDGFGLQTSTNLAEPFSWVNVTNSRGVAGMTNIVTIPLQDERRFFRLVRPDF